MNCGLPVIFLYSEAHGWNFGDKNRSAISTLPPYVLLYLHCTPQHRRKYPDIDKVLNAHEAMCYRAPTPAHLRFEHDSMVREMLRRLMN